MKFEDDNLDFFESCSDVWQIIGIGDIDEKLLYDTVLDQFYLCNKNTKILKMYPPIEEAFGTDTLPPKIKPCYIVQDPYKEDRFFKDIPFGQNVKLPCFNKFTHPSRLYGNSKEDHLPEVYEDFWRFLIPNDEHFTFFINWVASSLRQHNHTYLCLVGGTHGTGKGISAGIIKRLHNNNYETWNQTEIEETVFTPSFEGKTLLVIDELDKLTNKGYQRIKKLESEEIDQSLKNKDKKRVKNYLNIFLTCNKFENKLPPTERRFQFPDITDKKLAEHFNFKKYKVDGADQFYKKILLDFENISKLYRYLYHKEIPSNIMTQELDSNKKREIVELEPKEWEEFFIWFIESLYRKVNKSTLKKYNVFKNHEKLIISLDQIQEIIKHRKGFVPGRDKIKSTAEMFKSGTLTVSNGSKKRQTLTTVCFVPHDMVEFLKQDIENEERFNQVCSSFPYLMDNDLYHYNKSSKVIKIDELGYQSSDKETKETMETLY